MLSCLLPEHTQPDAFACLCTINLIQLENGILQLPLESFFEQAQRVFLRKTSTTGEQANIAYATMVWHSLPN